MPTNCPFDYRHFCFSNCSTILLMCQSTKWRIKHPIRRWILKCRFAQKQWSKHSSTPTGKHFMFAHKWRNYSHQHVYTYVINRKRYGDRNTNVNIFAFRVGRGREVWMGAKHNSHAPTPEWNMKCENNNVKFFPIWFGAWKRGKFCQMQKSLLGSRWKLIFGRDHVRDINQCLLIFIC